MLPSDFSPRLPVGTIAHHLSENTFRFYEPYLTLGVNNFPNETSWDVATLRAQNPEIKVGPVTFCARFRDAIVSLRRFQWETTVDTEKLIRIAGRFHISLQSGTSVVWFKNKQRQGRPPEYQIKGEQHVVAGGPGSGVVLWKDATLQEIEALCLLLHHNRLVGPYLLSEKLSDAQVEHFLNLYNVSILWDDANKQTVVT